jgi:hypothetical protein
MMSTCERCQEHSPVFFAKTCLSARSRSTSLLLLLKQKQQLKKQRHKILEIQKPISIISVSRNRSFTSTEWLTPSLNPTAYLQP